MTTISTILESHPDGTLHLPVPEALRHCKVKVEATLEPVPFLSGPSSEEERKRQLQALLKNLREQNPFRDIEDPIAWQREMREDRNLPWPE